IAPQDRRAIEDWIGEWADPKQGAELIASLPSLPTGAAWVWSPEAGILRRWQVPLAGTLDTGKPSPDPIELGHIDIAAVQAKLGEVAAEVVANDPATLRRRIRELEAAVKAAADHAGTIPAPVVETVIQRVEVPVLDDADRSHLRQAANDAAAAAAALENAAQEILGKLDWLETPRAAPDSLATVGGRAPRTERTTPVRPEAPPRPVVAQSAERRGAGLATAEAPGSNPGHGAGGASLRK